MSRTLYSKVKQYIEALIYVRYKMYENLYDRIYKFEHIEKAIVLVR